jgi:hypothetical protein
MVNSSDQKYSINEITAAPRCTYVVVYTDKNVLKGYTTHAISERFLDILNQGSVINDQSPSNDFLPLDEVEIYDLEGVVKGSAKTCLLNKYNILLVAECNTYGESPPSTPFRYTSFKRKKPVQVSIQIRDFTVVGQVYIKQSGESIKSLEMDKMFIPVTVATLSNSLNILYFEYKFLAINKNQIISISEHTE